LSALAIRIILALMWILHRMPLSLLAPLGSSLGMLLFALSRERRLVARTNLRLCFPAWTAQAREQVVRAHFRCFGRALLESSIA
jgi:KDO2-lipid IV(A) lauroyltransferase